MANQNKTVPTAVSPETYLQAIDNPKRQEDCRKIAALMEEETGHPPVMWGSSIVGFGTYHYKYESGREGDFMQAGFSNRKQSITLYILAGFSRYEELMGKLGKFKTGKSCLYIKSLDDVDETILRELVRSSVEWIRKKYPKP